MKSLLFVGILAVELLRCASAASERTIDIEYGKAGGESLKLDAWVPEGTGPFPAVILVHGGGWINGDKSGGPRKAFMVPMHEPLEKAGFAWFSINYRLAPKNRYPACIEDVETAIRWVKAHAAEYKIDPKRIAISGESAGGHLVALAAVRAAESTRLAAVVPFYAPFDLTMGATAGEPLRANFKALFGGETVDEATLGKLKGASPASHVKAGLPPFLLLHGSADTTVPIKQSELFQEKLKAAGVACDLIVINDGVHGMMGWSKLAPDYKDRVVAWLQKQMPAK